MTIGSSLLLIAAGAILKWAITAQVQWLNLQNTGVILMVVGGVGLCIGLLLLFWPRWSAGPRPGPPAGPP
ncbi:MAG TPA: hypothetical protein VIH85_09510 [Solirubrobacteraceae bacterium]|jgi:hypothetical protein